MRKKNTIAGQELLQQEDKVFSALQGKYNNQKQNGTNTNNKTVTEYLAIAVNVCFAQHEKYK